MSTIKQKPYFCIFCGGAIRGLSYIGALKALQELDVEVKSYAGASVGAIFAVFASLAYTPDELENVFAEVNFDLFRDVQFNLAKNFAISKGEHFVNWIRNAIEKKFYGADYRKGENEPVTFKDIDKDCFVITTNINGCEPCVFSKYTTPDFEVAQAIKISTALPGLLEPFNYEDKVLIDGDMMKSWPLWRISELLCPEDCRILEFRLEGSEHWSNAKNSVEYLNAVFATMSNFAAEFLIDVYQPKDKFDYIKIDTQHVLPVQFTLPQKDKDALIEIGYNSTIKYFKEALIEKKKILLPQYQVLLDHFLKAKNSLSDKNLICAKLHIYDMFVYLCESKRYIDVALYEKIIKFKNFFFSNLKESRFLHHLKLDNQKVVMSMLNGLCDDTLCYCLEIEDFIKSMEL